MNEIFDDSITITIRDFTKKYANKEMKKYETDLFTLCDFSWQLIYFPSGNPLFKINNKYFSLYLKFVEDLYSISLNTKFRITLIDNNNNHNNNTCESIYKFKNKNDDWGFGYFIELFDLLNSKFLNDDCLTILIQSKINNHILRNPKYQFEFANPDSFAAKNLVCSICVDILYEPVSSLCSHLFCKKCIESWNYTNKQCPICRADITILVPSLLANNLLHDTQFICQNFTGTLKELEIKLKSKYLQ